MKTTNYNDVSYHRAFLFYVLVIGAIIQEE